MPYDPNDPPDKLNKLPKKKQRQWVHVFNNCWEDKVDDAKCHQMAWGTVKSAREIASEMVVMAKEFSASPKSDVGKKVATALYNDYWNFHTRILESLGEDNGGDWVDENHQIIVSEIEKFTDAYYRKIKRGAGR